MKTPRTSRREDELLLLGRHDQVEPILRETMLNKKVTQLQLAQIWRFNCRTGLGETPNRLSDEEVSAYRAHKGRMINAPLQLLKEPLIVM